MAIEEKDARRSSAETQRTGSGRASRGPGQRVQNDPAIREAAAFYERAVNRPDVRAILEDLAKV